MNLINNKIDLAGSSISVLCSIDNRSEESMQLLADLKQYVTFSARGKRKYTSQTLVNVRGTRIEPQSQQTEALSLPIPSSAPVVHENCKIIEISYFVRIMLSDHLKCKLPIILTQNLPIDWLARFQNFQWIFFMQYQRIKTFECLNKLVQWFVVSFVFKWDFN